MRTLQRIFVRLLGSIVCLFFSILVIAFIRLLPGAQADTANLNLTLIIVQPPNCSFSGTGQNVNFGDVEQGLVDGSYKRTQINYDLTCSGLESNALRMTLSGMSSSLGGGAAVPTNRTNLGVAIYRDSTRLSNNAALNFTNGSPPTLYAVPVKPAGMMLTAGGVFSGTLTMTLSYQ